MGLLEKIEDRSALVGVVGLGYAGLPLAVAFADAGFNVVGVDLDCERVEKLNRGESPVADVGDEQLRELVADGRFRATTDYAALREADATTICVPTPLAEARRPDLTFVECAAEGLAAQLRPGQLIVL